MSEKSTYQSESQNIPVYGTHFFQCINPQKIFWRQLATDKLDFRIRFNLLHDTRDLGFYTGLIFGKR